ncbi:MAG: hypothetical protein IMZ61_05840 [Planctomycetes bacterium]|nr:hypothetical protein [Planctomycetota bacterium]
MNQLLNELFALIELTVRCTRAALGSYLAIAQGGADCDHYYLQACSCIPNRLK